MVAFVGFWGNRVYCLFWIMVRFLLEILCMRLEGR